ncbi:MAG: OmpA family protein [Bacteroidetes bacterium]|nr:OmpA family protein [Bacteroidota bacterium]
MKQLLFSLLFSSTLALAQNNVLVKANKYYASQSYALAIPLYEKAYKKDSSDKILLSNLADCYRLTNNINGQLKCYSNLVRFGKAEPIHKLYYGEALMSAGRTSDAKKYFDDFTKDSRGKNKSTYSEKYKSYIKNFDAYKVDLAPFNSEQNDMCAVNYSGGAIIFASSRSKTSWINVQHSWTNTNFLNIYETEKDKLGNYLQPQAFMRDLQSRYNDGPICFTKDYSKVFFTRNNIKSDEKSGDGKYKLKILSATLNKNGFDRVSELSINNKDYNVAHPALSPDGNTLYYASDMSGGFGGMDLYMSKKESDGNWGKPINLGSGINTAGNELFPFMANNGLFYFSSDGLDGMGGLDIYETKFKEDKAQRVYNMGEPINGQFDDFGIYISEDNKNGFISSNRKRGGLDDDIYFLQILKEVKRGKEIILYARNKQNGDSLPNTKIKFGESELTTNEQGKVQTLVEEEINYPIVIEKEDYFKFTDSVNTKSDPNDSFIKTLLLEKDPKLALVGVVTDLKTNLPLEGVKIEIKELPSKVDFDNTLSGTKGDYKKALRDKKIGDKISYEIKLSKQGYVDKVLTFIYDINKPGDINLNESVELKIGQVAVGMDLAKMIDMKPIYFDIGKSNIKPDAAIELDKVVKVMKEYSNMIVELGSHTDCRGSAAANLKLSSARAKSSASYIIKQGIDKTRISGKGYGESKLLNDCKCEGKVQSKCSEAEHALNRRTEFIITKLK